MSDRAIDQKLVNSFREGNLNAYVELVDKYTQKVHNLAFRISRNEEDTEEIIQDVFVTVYQKIDKFEGKAAFSSWLYRITANTAFMKLRKRKQHQVVSIEDAIEGGTDTIIPSADDTNIMGLTHEVREYIEKALDYLPAEYRAIFVLRDVDGMSNQDVAEILGITVPAVKSRLHRSRLMLRKKLQRFYSDYTNQDKISYGPNYNRDQAIVAA
jgi:RNA polymerase sigma-70 factor (ECF subfamily)